MSTGWQSIDAALAALGLRFGGPTVGQTTGGSHVAGSLHYQGLARDYGVSSSDVDAITAALTPYAIGANSPIIELFSSRTNTFYDNGQPLTPSASLRQEHYDHVHVALRPGVDLAGVVAGDMATTVDGSSASATPVSLTSNSFTKNLRGVALTSVFVAAGVALVALGTIHGTGARRLLGGTP